MEAGVVGPGTEHPLEAMTAGLEAAAAGATGAPAWTLSPQQLSELLPRLARVERQLGAARLAMLAEADRQQVGDPVGYSETAGWWAAVTRATKPEARRQVKLARRLDTEQHAPVREATAAGAVSLDQAQVIIKAVEDLPTDLTDAALRAKAENHLIEFAAELDPKQLAVAGRKILDVEAPEISEQALDRALQAEEAHAEATSYFTIRPDGHGSMIGRFKVPLLAGRILEKHVEALAAPKHQNAVAATDGTVPKPWRRGTAFTEYLQTRPLPSIPNAGGIAATVVVTMSLEALLGDLKAAALLDTGEAISAAQARHLACRAGIIPAVLDGKSEVLDLGRKRRFHTPAQRLAIALRDKTCIVEDCDRGPRDTHIHHLDQWERDHGGTSVERGALICPPHHTQNHDPRYGHTSRPGGKIKFNRRT